MNEQEKAAFYEAHKDDPAIWGEADERDAPRANKTLSTTITVRFPPNEAENIRHMAQTWRLSYSDIVREAVRLFAARPPLERRNVNVNYACWIQSEIPTPKVTYGENFRRGRETATGTLTAAR